MVIPQKSRSAFGAMAAFGAIAAFAAVMAQFARTRHRRLRDQTVFSLVRSHITLHEISLYSEINFVTELWAV